MALDRPVRGRWRWVRWLGRALLASAVVLYELFRPGLAKYGPDISPWWYVAIVAGVCGVMVVTGTRWFRRR